MHARLADAAPAPHRRPRLTQLLEPAHAVGSMEPARHTLPLLAHSRMPLMAYMLFAAMKACATLYCHSSTAPPPEWDSGMPIEHSGNACTLRMRCVAATSLMRLHGLPGLGTETAALEEGQAQSGRRSPAALSCSRWRRRPGVHRVQVLLLLFGGLQDLRAVQGMEASSHRHAV